MLQVVDVSKVEEVLRGLKMMVAARLMGHGEYVLEGLVQREGRGW